MRKVVRTDLSISVPSRHYGRVAPRSGLAYKHGIDIGAGVIDSDYTGPLGIVMINNGVKDFEIKVGDRVAQLLLERVSVPPVEEVEALAETVPPPVAAEKVDEGMDERMDEGMDTSETQVVPMDEYEQERKRFRELIEQATPEDAKKGKTELPEETGRPESEPLPAPEQWRVQDAENARMRMLINGGVDADTCAEPFVSAKVPERSEKPEVEPLPYDPTDPFKGAGLMRDIGGIAGFMKVQRGTHRYPRP